MLRLAWEEGILGNKSQMGYAKQMVQELFRQIQELVLYLVRSFS